MLGRGMIGFGLAFSTIILGIIVLVFLLLGLLIAAWIFRDAKKRKIKPLKWVLIAIFLSFIGLIIYLLFVKRKRRR